MEITEQELADKISEAVNDAVSGLKTKNQSLLDKLANSKKFDGVDIEALQADSAELAAIKTKAEEDKGEYKKLYTDQQVQHEQTVGGLNDEISTLKETLKLERKTNAVTSALAESGVIPELMDVASAVLIKDVAINDDGVAMVGDKGVAEHVKEWSTSEVGSHFIKSGNSGGGANGSGKQNHAEEAGWFKKGSDTYNLTKQAQLSKSNPALYKTLAAQG